MFPWVGNNVTSNFVILRRYILSVLIDKFYVEKWEKKCNFYHTTLRQKSVFHFVRRGNEWFPTILPKTWILNVHSPEYFFVNGFCLPLSTALKKDCYYTETCAEKMWLLLAKTEGHYPYFLSSCSLIILHFRESGSGRVNMGILENTIREKFLVWI